MATPKTSAAAKVKVRAMGGYGQPVHSISFKTKGGTYRETVVGTKEKAIARGMEARKWAAFGARAQRNQTPGRMYKATKAERFGMKIARASKQRRDAKGRFA